MKSFFEMPQSDEELEEQKPSRRKTIFKIVVSAFVGAAVVSSLAATINIGDGDSFEFGQRSYDVGSCATSVNFYPKTVGSSPLSFTQLSVTGISSVACDNRLITLTSYETGSPERVLATFQIYVSGGEFRGSQDGLVSADSDPTGLLRQSTSSTSIFSSPLTAGGKVFSAGGGRTLRSLDDDLSGLSLSFQLQISPGISLSPGSTYARTDIQIQAIAPATPSASPTSS